ncbi:uncharacterized protein [Chelonus insularis]|uniref:uncharacterized protein n=1 Tax=Chelonus insularis TaxID=460826 RepID=UPI0015897C2B|nr:uncharacterized protein LOC118073944 [Chelonus insularis]
MPSNHRNPYPVPNISSEGYWYPNGPVLGKNISPYDRSWQTKANVPERLFSHHTLNSIRRDCRLIRQKEPRDALDFALSSIYVHSDDFMVPKMYVFMQPESLNLQTWRQLRNELKPPMSSMTTEQKARQKNFSERVFSSKNYHSTSPSKNNYTTTEPSKEYSHKRDDILDKNQRRVTYASQMRAIERIHPSSLKLAIEGPHADQTNPGYSRKTDGTFYSI